MPGDQPLNKIDSGQQPVKTAKSGQQPVAEFQNFEVLIRDTNQTAGGKKRWNCTRQGHGAISRPH